MPDSNITRSDFYNKEIDSMNENMGSSYENSSPIVRFVHFRDSHSSLPGL